MRATVSCRPAYLGVLAVMSLLSLVLTASPGAAQSPSPMIERPMVVVTTPMLGWLATSLAGDGADVAVLMDSGIDPHDWEPSARDVEMLSRADLVVANGSGLEEGLDGVLDQLHQDGVTVFEATDHVVIGEPGDANRHDGHDKGGDDDHMHAGRDPHFWTDPVAMRSVAIALAEAMTDNDIAVGSRGQTLGAELLALDVEVRSSLLAVPPEHRKLATGHESLGYFADRYGFELVGTVVPGLSSHGDVSARELADLADIIRAEDVAVIFAEVGTPADVAEAIASETGARTVGVTVEQLPPDGSYATYLRQLADTIARALSTGGVG